MIRRATYVGPVAALQGKTATVQENSNPELLYVQFDDINTGFGHGWHWMAACKFLIHEEEAKEQLPAVENKTKTEWQPDAIEPSLLTKKLREW